MRPTNQRCTRYPTRRLPRHRLLRALAEDGLLIEIKPGWWIAREPGA